MEWDLVIGICGFIMIGLIMFIISINKANILLGKKKTKKKKETNILPVKYLEMQFGIKRENLLNKQMLLLLSYINSFIISLVYYVIMKLPFATIWKLAVAFILLFGLIYAIYEILGRILKKKGL